MSYLIRSFLIEKGADIFHQNAAQDIALSFAAENGHLDVLQLFVDLGCHPVNFFRLLTDSVQNSDGLLIYRNIFLKVDDHL